VAIPDPPLEFHCAIDRRINEPPNNEWSCPVSEQLMRTIEESTTLAPATSGDEVAE
jgi:hypothetical protein